MRKEEEDEDRLPMSKNNQGDIFHIQDICKSKRMLIKPTPYQRNIKMNSFFKSFLKVKQDLRKVNNSLLSLTPYKSKRKQIKLTKDNKNSNTNWDTVDSSTSSKFISKILTSTSNQSSSEKKILNIKGVKSRPNISIQNTLTKNDSLNTTGTPKGNMSEGPYERYFTSKFSLSKPVGISIRNLICYNTVGCYAK